MRLIPRLLSLVQALEFIGDDECVDVTPKKREAPEGGALRTAAPDHDVAEEARARGYLVRRPTIGRNPSDSARRVASARQPLREVRP